MNNEIKDKFGRRLRYLRISVTDRCNFRCKYCMPNNNFEMMDKSADHIRFISLILTIIFICIGIVWR